MATTTLTLPEGWKSPITPEYLTRFNKIMFVIHGLQGLLMILLGTVLEFSRDLYAFYWNYDGLSQIPPIPPFVDPRVEYTFTALGAAVGSFLLMSSLAHFLLAWPLNKRYVANLQKNRNPLRFLEYGFSSSVMIVLIAIFFGVVDIWTLFAIFASNFLMNMFGLVMERSNPQGNADPKKVDWLPYIFGCVAGIIPWIIITGYFVGTGATPPDFVYAIYIIEFVLFNCFALVMVAYYKRWGKFTDYAYGERIYQILSIVAKTLLAWLVFAGVFQPA
jgi:hypothetical protein